MDQRFFQNIPAHIWELVGKLELGLSQDHQNPQIIELLQRTILLGGKRFRPLLTFLMGDFFQIQASHVAPYAKAIELVHAASLAHDDVIDNATMRRGLDSINIVASNKKAVLSGDYLLANVIVDVCRLGKIELVSELSLVIKDLSDGEWLQLESCQFENFHWDYIEKIALKKTASVMSWCCVAPAILSNGPRELVDLAREFGKNLGLAFQFIDDTLDYSDLQLTGKDCSIDIKNGIINSVAFEALKEFKEAGEFRFDHFSVSLVEEKLQSLSAEQILSAADRVRSRAYAKLTTAREILQKIHQSAYFKFKHTEQENIRPLLFVLDYLLERKK